MSALGRKLTNFKFGDIENMLMFQVFQRKICEASAQKHLRIAVFREWQYRLKRTGRLTRGKFFKKIIFATFATSLFLTFGAMPSRATEYNLKAIDTFRMHLMDYQEDLLNLAEGIGYDMPLDGVIDVCTHLSLELEHVRDLTELAKSSTGNATLAKIRLSEKKRILSKNIDFYMRSINLSSNREDTNPTLAAIANSLKIELRSIKESLTYE